MTARFLARGWRVFVPVVILNALVQAATTFPFLTPSTSFVFVLLALASAVALVVSAALVSAQTARHERLRVGGMLWLAASAAVVVIGASALLSLPLILVTLTLAYIVLPGIAAGRPGAGLRAFGATPLRAIGLTVLTVLVLIVLWVGALLLGFLVTGALSAALTWLLFGAAGVWLACGWAALMTRSV